MAGWEQLWFPFEWARPAELVTRTRRRAGRPARRVIRGPKQQTIRFPRKCSPLIRARSIPAKKLTRRELEDARIRTFLEPGWDADRPRRWEDCEGGVRPCPWVGCRANLYLDVNEETGSLKLNFPDREPWEMPPDASCVLDIAERVADGAKLSLQEVGAYLNLSLHRVRQLSARGLQGGRLAKMREERLLQIGLPRR